MIITRLEPAASALAGRVQALGLRPVVAPMLTIRPRGDPMPALDGAAALLLTSANGLVGLAARPAAEQASLRGLPVWCVGPATAAAAEAAGYTVAATAAGDGAALARAVAARLSPAAGWLLHAAGEDVAGGLDAGLASGGFSARRWVVYSARTATVLPVAAREALAGDGPVAVLFFSGRSAAAFATLAADHAAPARLTAFCLSERVARAALDAAPVWAGVQVAARPEEDSLLADLAIWRRQSDQHTDRDRRGGP
ncbi:MAG: uroporphyrinogen-III synthase [Alphaproteobacteria bacterium]